MVFNISTLLFSCSGFLFYLLIFSIINRRGLLANLVFFFTFIRLIGAILSISAPLDSASSYVHLFVTLTIILNILEFCWLYKSLGSYLPSLVITITSATLLQTSFIFVNGLNFILKNEDTVSIFILMTQPLIYIFTLVALYRFEKKYNLFTDLMKINKKFKLLSLVAFCSFVSISAVNLISYFFSNTLLYVYGLLLLYIFLIFMYILLKNYIQTLDQAAELQIQIQNTLDNQQQVILTNEFRHDFKSILLSLSGYLENNDIVSAQNQLNEIISYSQPILEPNVYTQLNNLKIISLQGYFFDFFSRCKKENIQTNLLVKKEITSIGINPLDLVRCVSIICNNALEASVAASKKKLITTIITTNDHSLIISVENAIDDNVDLKNMMQRGHTTKANHSGYGLSVFSKLLDGYKNTDYFFKSENKTFTATFYVPLK